MSTRPTLSHESPQLNENPPSPERTPGGGPGADVTDEAVIAGVDIGGTTTHAVLCTPDFGVLARTSAPTPTAGGGTAMIGLAIDLVEHLLAEAGAARARLIGVGVGAAGVVDNEAGVVLVASDTFTNWAGHPITGTITERFGVPAFLENDVNAFLVGEVFAGAITGEANALAIMLGTGVGGALWLDGRLYGGPRGAAGEIGHTPGFGVLPCSCRRHGHLETLAGGRQLGLRYAERAGAAAGPEVGADEVYRRAIEGDAVAREVFATAGRALAQAITTVAALMDVTTVVIGGGVANAWPLLEPAIRRELDAEPPVSGHPIVLQHSTLGDDAVAVGAAIQAHRRLAAPVPSMPR